MALFH